MNIKTVPVKSIIPYKNNPRLNKAAVDAVMESIIQCGYCAPIVVDEDNVVLAGHTRLKAIKKLGWETVEVCVKDGLTEEQKRKYRILDNKVGEIAQWDYDLLEVELDGLDFGNFDFGFDLPDEEEEHERRKSVNDDEYSINLLRLREFDPSRAEGFYQMPTIEPCYYVPESMTRFKEFATGGLADTVHFFVDDYRFERLWVNPEKFITEIKMRAKAALSPDYSLYTDMPEALKIYNVYRSHLIGQMMQDAGIPVIPTLQWAQEPSFQYCFDGLPKNSVVAVSTVGVARGGDREIWRAGMDEAIKRLQPSLILQFGADISKYDYQGIPVKRYKAYEYRR